MPGAVTSELTRQQQMQGNIAATQDPDVVENEVVNESQTVAQPISSEQAPSIYVNPNMHTIAWLEASDANPMYDKVDPQSEDRFRFTGRSIAPEVLQDRVSANANTVVTAAKSDVGALEISVNGQHVEVPGMSLRTIRLNQDKYPDFIVLGMPNLSTGKFNLHVTDKATGYALNQEQLIMFVNNVVLPALSPQEDRGVTELAS